MLASLKTLQFGVNIIRQNVARSSNFYHQVLAHQVDQHCRWLLPPANSSSLQWLDYEYLNVWTTNTLMFGPFAASSPFNFLPGAKAWRLSRYFTALRTNSKQTRDKWCRLWWGCCLVGSTFAHESLLSWSGIGPSQQVFLLVILPRCQR